MKILSIICIRSYFLRETSLDCSILQEGLTVVGSTAGGVGILLLLLALDQLCRHSVCCASMSMITGTVVSAGTNCEDIVSAG